jgi:hypothetical protein
MNSPIDLLVWITATCAIGLIWSLGIKRLALDIFRERLFEIRFQLYTMAMDGELSQEEAAYRNFELLLCGMVRFAHRITFSTFVFSHRQQQQAMKEKDYVDVGKLLTSSMLRLAPDTKRKLNEISESIRTALLLYMVLSSIPLFTVMMAYGIASRLRLTASTNTKEQFSTPIEQEAYRFGTKRQQLNLAHA